MLYLAVLAIFLGSMWGPMGFLSINIGLGVDAWEVVSAGLLIFATGMVIFGFGIGLTRVFGLKHIFGFSRLAALVTVGIAGLFLFNPVHRFIAQREIDWSITGSWLLLYGGCLLVAGLLIRSHRGLIILVVGLLAMNLVSVSNVVHDAITTSVVAKQNVSKNSEPSLMAKQTRRTNVYYFLIDGYVRSDELLRKTGLDNSPFLIWLRERGFRVLENSRSNYSTTHLVVPSTLLTDFVTDEAGLPTHTVKELFDLFEGNNPVARRFHREGYENISIGMGVCSTLTDRCFSPLKNLSEEEWNLFYLTPLPVVLSHLSSELFTQLTHFRLLQLFEAPAIVEELRRDGMYVFGYFIDLHDTIYDGNCDVRGPDLHTQLAKLREEDRMLKDVERYTDTVKCVNEALQLTIEAIEKNDPDALIVLAADHGTGFPEEEGEDSQMAYLRQRTAIFNAWKVPERCDQFLHDHLTSVNHFRVVFSCLFGDSAPMKPDRVFSSKGLNSYAAGERFEAISPERLE